MHNLHLNISSLPFFNHADTEINAIYRFRLGQKAGGGCCQSLGHAQDGRQLPARVSQKQSVPSPHGRTVLTTIITGNTQHPLLGKAKGDGAFHCFSLCRPLLAPNGAPDFKHNNRLWNITRSNSGCNLHVIFLFQRPALPRIAESGPAHNGMAIKGGKKDNNRFFILQSQRPDCLCPPPIPLVMHRTCAEAAPQTSSARTKTSGGRMRPCLTKVNLDGAEQLQTSHSGASMKHFPQQTEGPLDSPGFNLSY